MAQLPDVQRRKPEPRPNTTRRGYDSKWQQYSRRFLAEHLACADPLNRHPNTIMRSEVTDHIKAHKLFEAISSGDKDRIKEAQHLFWSTGNHQPLCADCNRAKNILEEGGMGRG